jgi:ABC-type antimicrobial peptide transport system permease subunit
MKIIKRHSLILSFLLVLLGIVSGFVIGWFYAGWRVEVIADDLRRANPNDPLDGLLFISMGIILKSAFIGTLCGVIAGTISYFFVGKSRNLI